MHGMQMLARTGLPIDMTILFQKTRSNGRSHFSSSEKSVSDG